MPEVVEKPVAEWPGWIKVQMGTSRRYRSPGGVEISARRFMELNSKYKGQSLIPESDVLPTTHQPSRGFISGQSYKSNLNQNSEPNDSEPTEYSEAVMDVKPRSSHSTKSNKHPKASAQALGLGMRKLILLITTLIIAKILNDERACMTDKEATILGAALGNLLEPTKFNEQFGWMIADTGDYQAIIYVLIMYGSRINDIVREKRQHEQHAPNAGGSPTRPTTSKPESQGSNGATPASQPGAALPYSTARPQWTSRAS